MQFLKKSNTDKHWEKCCHAPSGKNVKTEFIYFFEKKKKKYHLCKKYWSVQ